MTIHIGPRTVSAIGGSIKRVGNYRIHTFPSELVTDGLVLNLDAGDPRSYPGSGTSWTDLSGNGRIGTLTNGPTYENANGGSIVFDGVNDFVSFSSAPDTNVSGYSIGAWFRVSSFGVNIAGLVSYGNEVNYQRRALFLYDVTSPGLVKLTSSTYNSNILGATTLALNTWYYGMVTVSSTGETKIYLNGVLDGTGTNILATPTSNTLYVGRTGTGEYFNGRIPSAQIYNRVLSAAEVAQNYDALKVRYTGYTNTFTPLCAGGSGKVEVLCVAGGGGGAVGGGGAGGLVYNSAFTINSNVAVGLTVGTGGTGASSWGQNGLSGGNSVFSSLNSIGGGYGAHGGEGSSGGSGGGGGYSATGNASAISGQGNAGGRGGSGAPNYPGGGGGGAGSIGSNGSGTSTAGAGGSGLSYSISGVSQFYAGGGGGATQGGGTGGLGGSGVGGNGASGNVMGLNGIPNTGSGGGGSGQNLMGGNGSNGIVIVRYPATDYNVELLIVGGGGGGGFSVGSGGGAGGLIYYSSYPVSSGTKYTVTVGAGSAAMNSTIGVGTAASNGGNSIFGPLVAYGGGGGTGQSVGFPSGTGGKSGGSGSGGTRNQNTPGQGVPGQGNAGGRGSDTANAYGGGGGGGAGAVGGDGSGTVGGNGGIGLAFSISGISTYYAGGGGGATNNGTPGSGGLGGGGAGGNGINGTSAIANTGGGGGAGDASGSGGSPGTTGGAGGSGIVIIAYQGPQRGIGGTVDTTSRPGYTLHRFTTTGTDFFIP